MMLSEVNKPVLEGKRVCIREMQKGNNRYDTLIKVDYVTNNNILVIQILYEQGEENYDKNKKGLNDEKINMSINIKISGVDVGKSEMRFGIVKRFRLYSM